METFSNNQLKLNLRLRAAVCVSETTNDIRQITFVTVMSITTDVATIYYTHMNIGRDLSTSGYRACPNVKDMCFSN